MSRVLLSALLLTSCAAEVAPHADPGDPRVMPVGAVAALDGSFSEGEGLSYAWSVSPEHGATLTEPESPFATLTAQAPGLYTLSLEVCDESGRCDQAETWARVDAPGSASRISDWGIDEFAGVESGAGAPLGAFTATPAWCKKCLDMAEGTADEWDEFCSSGLPRPANDGDKRECGRRTFLNDQERRNYCYARGCEK